MPTLALLLGAALVAAAGGTANPERAPAAAVSLFEYQGTAQPGTAQHGQFQRLLDGVHPNVALQFQLAYPESAQGFVGALLGDPAAGAADFSFQAPAPSTTPGVPGSTEQRHDPCWHIAYAGRPGTADVQWDWNFQHTADRDGDGVLDSDPQWVLTGFKASRIRILPPGTAADDC